jgi:hypothetical protein
MKPHSFLVVLSVSAAIASPVSTSNGAVSEAEILETLLKNEAYLMTPSSRISEIVGTIQKL